MSERLLKLANRIRNEVEVLHLVLARVQEGWHRGQLSGDDYYLDSVALNLHSFYAGVERLFELIAGVVDGSLPQGANWHQILLQQMASEMLNVRPAVISEATRDTLDTYRGFRHVVRNVYTFKFDPAKMQELVEDAPKMFRQVAAELLAFADFLELRGGGR